MQCVQSLSGIQYSGRAESLIQPKDNKKLEKRVQWRKVTRTQQCLLLTFQLTQRIVDSGHDCAEGRSRSLGHLANSHVTVDVVRVSLA